MLSGLRAATSTMRKRSSSAEAGMAMHSNACAEGRSSGMLRGPYIMRWGEERVFSGTAWSTILSRQHLPVGSEGAMGQGSPQFERVVWIVLDSVGIGALPDAADYGDVGRDTLGHIARSRPLQLSNLVRLGIANITPLDHLTPPDHPAGSFAKGASHSPGKDTTTGHWEMAGIWLPQAFPVYPHGFPAEIIAAFEKQIGRQTLANKPASGTEIIKELGEEHVRTGKPIVYTSGDSVFQIAAHEDVIP